MQRIAPRATDIKGASPIQEVEAAVIAINGGSSRSSPSFGAGVVMLAGMLVGHNPGVLSSYTKQPRRLIDEVGRRLRRNGVWAGGATYCEWFESEESTSFLLDLNVAMGQVLRPSGASGPALYRPSDAPLDEPGRIWDRVIDGDEAAAPAAAAPFSAVLAAAGAPLGWLLHLDEVSPVDTDVVRLSYEREEHGLASGLSVVDYYVPLEILREGSTTAISQFIETGEFLKVEERLRATGSVGPQARQWVPPPDFPFDFRPSAN